MTIEIVDLPHEKDGDLVIFHKFFVCLEAIQAIQTSSNFIHCQAPLLPTRRCLRSCARAVAARYTGRWEGPGAQWRMDPGTLEKLWKVEISYGDIIYTIYIYIYISHISFWENGDIYIIIYIYIYSPLIIVDCILKSRAEIKNWHYKHD